MNTLNNDIATVRRMLGDPLGQSPSVLDILEELRIEYHALTNDLNNTTDVWLVETTTITTVAGTYEYLIQPEASNKSVVGKVISVVTVPADSTLDPEFILEFVDLDNFPREWAWISQNKGAYAFSSHDGQLVSFYYKYTQGEGWVLYCQIRPVPANAQTYKIYYQPADWWDLDQTLGRDLQTPVETQRFLVCAMAAKNLLLTGKVKWGYDDKTNIEKAKIVMAGLESRIDRYLPIYAEFKDGLVKSDILTLDSWSDENVLQ